MKDEPYQIELLGIFKSIPDEKKEAFITRFSSQSKNPTKVFGFSVFLGYWGVDRFILGQTGFGILKLVTVGGLGFWALVDLFLVAGIARKINIETARKIASTI